MKARSILMSAASAVAISTRLVATGIVASSMVYASTAQAASFSSISVSGNVRVEAQTIKDYIGIKPGQAYSASDIDEAIKRLYSTGLFSDVSIRQNGGTLSISVVENNVINQVIFKGNKKIKDVNLANRTQLKGGGSLDANVMEQDAEVIREAYRNIGRNDVVVTPTTVDLGEGRVNVVYEIAEGDRTKIASINFVGNNAYGDRRLAEVLSTKKSNLLSFFSRNDIYDEERIKADEEALRRFYFNHGYADFQVVSSVAELDEATNKYTITVTVDEGERYKFGDITIESTVEGITSEDLSSSVETRQGKTYSAKDVEDTLIGLSEKVANKGYAFAEVTPRGDRDFANRTINIVYTVDQGQRAYVERIEVRGNDKTRDYVIRREFDLSEGDAFNQVAIQKAKRRLEKLGYFERVEISTAPGAEPDQVVLVVDVVEKSTGEFSVGAGYSSGGENQGANLEVGVTERNFLGRGQYLKVSAGGSADSRTYNLSFTEPYFLGYRVAAGFDIFKNTNNYNTDSASAYDVERTGATVRFGLPITDQLSAQIAYNFVSEDYVRGEGNTSGLPNYIPEGNWIKSSLSYTLTFDTIDDKNNPHAGIFARFSQEVAGIGGDAQWLKTTAKATYYHTLSEEMNIVGVLVGGGGHIMPFDSKDAAENAAGIRVGDLFKANSDIVRGFDFNGFGPKIGTDYIGGTTYFNASAEVQFPLPAVPDSIGLKGAFFADIGTLYGAAFTGAGTAPFVPVTNDGMAWRASIGASLLWASPFGPLRVDYALPVMKEPGDQIQNFNFGISTKF